MQDLNKFENQTLTVKEVALILKIDVKSVYDRIYKNRLPGVFKSGRSIRFNAKVFYDWMNQCSKVQVIGVRE